MSISSLKCYVLPQKRKKFPSLDSGTPAMKGHVRCLCAADNGIQKRNNDAEASNTSRACCATCTVDLSICLQRLTQVSSVQVLDSHSFLDRENCRCTRTLSEHHIRGFHANRREGNM